MTLDFEQREARRKKILQNQKSRMDKILQLNGTTREPAIDGLGTRQEGEIPEETTVCHGKTERLAASPSSPSDAGDDIYSPLGSPPPQCVMPRLPWYRRPRCVAALLLGFSWRLLLAVATIPDRFASVAGPCVLLSASFELLSAVFAAATPGGWPSHGHLVNFLLSFGFCDTLVIWAGKAADTFSRLVSDAILVLIAFLALHVILS